MRRSQNLPLSLRIYPLSTTICDTTRIYPSLSKYTPPPFSTTICDAIFQESTPQSLNMPPFQELHGYVRESTTRSQNWKILWQGRVDSWMVAYRYLKGGIFWQGGVDSGRVAYVNLLKRGGSILGGVDSGNVAQYYSCSKRGRGLYSGRVA